MFERARQRTDRTAEILSQVRPQYAYWASVCNLHPETTPRTIELTYTALHFSMLITQRIKHALACPRPNEYSTLVQPIILTPAYSAFPMGHATEAYMFARVMSKLVGAGRDSQLSEQLHRLAKRISDNRVIAGVHFPIDTPAGYVLADALADYFVARCGVYSEIDSRTFDVSKLRIRDQDKTLDPNDDIDPTRLDKYSYLDGVPYEVESSRLLAALWTEAEEELKRQG